MLPVVTELARQGVVISIDTMRAEVAAAAVDAGAVLVNDVSGGMADPEMARLVASTGVSYVLMHWRGHSHGMQKRAVYTDVVQEVYDELEQRMMAVVDEGVDPSQIIIDPGLGFAKSPEKGHNWALLAHLDRFAKLERPILIGGSRETLLRAVAQRRGRQPAWFYRVRRRNGRCDRSGRVPRCLGGTGPRGAPQRGCGPGRLRVAEWRSRSR